tara:strand:- start:3790 stop:5424 length:1635 start_codon:yes stop_codon:yes gene_type:complete
MQLLVILNSVLQLLSILSFSPLILILLDNKNADKINLNYLPFIKEENLILSIIIIIITLFIISNFINIYVTKLSLNFGQQIGINLNYNIFNNIIHKDYDYHVNTNSAEIISKITLEVARVTMSIIVPIILINSRLIVLIFIYTGLAFYNFKVSIIILVVLAISYLVILSSNKNRFSKNSILITENNKIRQKIISESLGNMRETILFNSQPFFLNLFDKSNKNIAYSIASNQYLATIPRSLIEIIIFLIVMLAIFFLKNNNILEIYLPLIGVYLIAGYKLLPALQGLASSYASIKGNFSAFELIKKDFVSILENEEFDKKIVIKEKFENLELKNINFNFKNNQIFKDLNFKLNRGEFVSVIGETGSGKSTLIDIICGLLRINEGEFILNNINLSKKTNKKLIKVAIVPQKINLLDDTIKKNIYYSNNPDENKLNFLERTCILDYVNEKDDGWDTIVGENGSKLSGGQIQRLGIARALFLNPDILILDEATSGLDELIEEKLLKNLVNLQPNLTILMITHNKKLLKFSDKIYEIKNLKLIDYNQND